MRFGSDHTLLFENKMHCLSTKCCLLAGHVTNVLLPRSYTSPVIISMNSANRDEIRY